MGPLGSGVGDELEELLSRPALAVVEGVVWREAGVEWGLGLGA